MSSIVGIYHLAAEACPSHFTLVHVVFGLSKLVITCLRNCKDVRARLNVLTANVQPAAWTAAAKPHTSAAVRAGIILSEKSDDSTATFHPLARCERDTHFYPPRVAGARVTIGMVGCECEARVAAAASSALKLACLLAWLLMRSSATPLKFSDHSFTDPDLIHIVVPTECNEYQSWQVRDQVLSSLTG